MQKVERIQECIEQHGEIQPLFYGDFEWSIIYKKLVAMLYTSETYIMLITINFKNQEKNFICFFKNVIVTKSPPDECDYCPHVYRKGN